MKPRPFLHLWRSAVFNSRLPPAEKLALLALSEYADAGGNRCSPSSLSLAELTSANEKTVRRALAAAEARGWFARELADTGGKTGARGQGWRRYSYRLSLPEGADTTPARQRVRRADTMPAPSPEKVRTFPLEGAGTTPAELAFELEELKQEQEQRASRAVDPIWSTALEWLTSHGTPEAKARPILGRARKQFNDDSALLAAVEAGKRAGALDPATWILAGGKKAEAARATGGKVARSTMTEDEALAAMDRSAA